MTGNLHTVIIKLVERKGENPCPNGHKIGDEWVCKGASVPGGICSNAYVSLFPTIWALQLGVQLTSKAGPNSIRLACQDANVLNIFELSRVDSQSRSNH